MLNFGFLCFADLLAEAEAEETFLAGATAWLRSNLM
jgi:hypothetical protein